MANFNLPGMYEQRQLNFALLRLFREQRECFYPNLKFDAFYGNFQFCIFDGGRIFPQFNHTCLEEMEEILYQYNEIYRVPIRLVFTSNALTKEMFYNRFANVVLKTCENGFNEIAISDSELEKYIQDTYPDYKFISSTTKCLNTPALLKEELAKDHYSLVCLDYNLNKNFKMLDSFTQAEKDKCEFLVNAICPPGCPSRKEHYYLNSIYYLNYGKPYQMHYCPIKHNTLHADCLNSHNNLTPEEIYGLYTEKGFTHFKLEGRTLSTSHLASHYVNMLVLPEHKWYILSLLTDILEGRC